MHLSCYKMALFNYGKPVLPGNFKSDLGNKLRAHMFMNDWNEAQKRLGQTTIIVLYTTM